MSLHEDRIWIQGMHQRLDVIANSVEKLKREYDLESHVNYTFMALGAQSLADRMRSSLNPDRELGNILNEFLRSIGSEAHSKRISRDEEFVAILEQHDKIWREFANLVPEMVKENGLLEFHQRELPAVYKLWIIHNPNKQEGGSQGLNEVPLP